jgi:thioredoxin reductase (NADPH)
MDVFQNKFIERQPAASQDFPTLSPSEVQRLTVYGKIRHAKAREILIEQGEVHYPFFVILEGELDIVQPTDKGERTIAVHHPNQFTGEINMISNRRSLVIARMHTDGRLLQIEHDVLRTLIQTEADLSEIIMRAFILRRLLLVKEGFGDVVLLGSRHSSDTLRIREFLARNSHPFTYVDLDRDAESQQLLERFNVNIDDVPVIICRAKVVLKNPSNKEVADCLGFNASSTDTKVHDVIVVGAGPSGLAAAVYAASEGLDVAVLETNAPGGQAGSSSKIENYLGFPTGISGQELAGRAYTQAQKFGAEIMIARSAARLSCEQQPYTLETDGAGTLKGRTVVLATGAAYNRICVAELDRFEGKGIYYGATYIESQLCEQDDVIVVGGGNSAGQAAVFLSQTASKVYMLVRSGGLKDTMSKYLIRRIEDSSQIELLTNTEISGLQGEDHLECVRWRNRQTGEESVHQIGHVFIMTGASPNTSWLNGCVALDAKGFVKTGRDIDTNELAEARWPLERPPFLLETTLPGVFAVGDVRSGNVKRVASAVGEGSIAIHMVHQVLQQG